MGFAVVLATSPPLLCETLFEDWMACVVRQNHPTIHEGMSLEDYVGADHLLISSSGEEYGIIDKWLEQRGLQRRRALILTHFLSALFLVAKTDMVLSLPLRLAERFIHLAPLTIVTMPIELPAYKVVMAWHPVRDLDPSHLWLREQIRTASQTIATCPPSLPRTP